MADNDNDIIRYKDGSMTPAERHALEKKALSDPFLADALEGAEHIGAQEFSDDVSALQRQIREGKTRQPFFTPLRIAAGILLVAGLGAAIYLITPAAPGEQLATAPVAKDSISTKADTTLLTMAEEKKNEPVQEETRRAQPKISKPKPSSTEPSVATIGQQPVQIQIAEETKAEERKAYEEKEKAADLGLSDKQAAAPVAAARAGESQSKKAISSGGPTVHGMVTSAEDQGPMPGVNVLVKGTTRGTVTDAQGRFTLVADSVDQLEFSFIGFKTVETKVAGKSELKVAMTEDAAQLSEVVVTGLGMNKDDADKVPVVVKAAPLGGMKAYNKYLENNLKYPPQALAQNIKGKVTIQFTVTTSGALTEFSVVKSLGYGCDEEVIRLVKEGPAWNPGTIDDVPTENEVLVRLKFDPRKAQGR